MLISPEQMLCTHQGYRESGIILTIYLFGYRNSNSLLNPAGALNPFLPGHFLELFRHGNKKVDDMKKIYYIKLSLRIGAIPELARDFNHKPFVGSVQAGKPGYRQKAFLFP